MARATLATVALACCAAVLLAVPLLSAAKGISCVDGSGSPRDWWMMIKFPEIGSSSNPAVQQGYGYIYLDSESTKFELGAEGLDQADGPLARTLASIYYNDSTHEWFSYNDEEPTGKKVDDHGHNKGVVSFDSDQGYWLIHSVPRFPPRAGDGYSFPEDEKKYGQSFLCITMSTTALNVAGMAMQYNDPHIYTYNAPSGLQSVAPQIQAALAGVRNKDASPGTFVSKLQSLEGVTFQVFAKNKQWDNELYDALVAPTLGDDMKAETWLRDPKLPSYCGKPYQVLNVATLEDTTDSISFDETQDHSKWAVTSSRSVTCIGDINRMSSQAGRGGGTVCLDNTSVHSQFAGLIASTESC